MGSRTKPMDYQERNRQMSETSTDISDLFALDIQVITDARPGEIEAPCSTNDGCAASCASSCASRG
ncbi:FxLD family lanthipeptide [Fodinicola feengrottensis]|uniref:FxLD family lanthipeptide n=1 Tax=Fodinicola feengrottensis TaxID=435914 RepID=UPI0036F20BF5